MHPHPSLLTLLAATLAHARPSSNHLHTRGYGAITQLKPEYQALWYSKNPAGHAAAASVGSPDTNTQSDLVALANIYQCHGPLISDFPSYKQWPLTFSQLWTINEAQITLKNGGNMYNADIKAAILSQSAASKVDPRFVLGMIMQESTGYVGVSCTAGDDCGLLQVSGGRAFDPASPGASISDMIRDGIEGVAQTPGLLAYLNGDGISWIAGDFWKGNPFAAAHIYNTGGIVDEDLTKTVGGGKNTYAHDLAARLGGWDGLPGGCEMSRRCPGLGFEGRAC